jgi:hypothetical protein
LPLFCDQPQNRINISEVYYNTKLFVCKISTHLYALFLQLVPLYMPYFFLSFLAFTEFYSSQLSVFLTLQKIYEISSSILLNFFCLVPCILPEPEVNIIHFLCRSLSHPILRRKKKSERPRISPRTFALRTDQSLYSSMA